MFYNAGLLIALSLVGPCALTMISFSHQVQLRTLRFPLTTHMRSCMLLFPILSFYCQLILSTSFLKCYFLYIQDIFRLTNEICQWWLYSYPINSFGIKQRLNPPKKSHPLSLCSLRSRLTLFLSAEGSLNLPFFDPICRNVNTFFSFNQGRIKNLQLTSLDAMTCRSLVCQSEDNLQLTRSYERTQ